MLYHRERINTGIHDKNKPKFIERLKYQTGNYTMSSTIFYFYFIRNKNVVNLYATVNLSNGDFYAAFDGNNIEARTIVKDYKDGESWIYLGKETSFKRV